MYYGTPLIWCSHNNTNYVFVEELHSVNINSILKLCISAFKAVNCKCITANMQCVH